MLDTEKYRIAVIGAGPAGRAAALSAATLGVSVDWYDKQDRAGGKLNEYHQLFPHRVKPENLLSGFRESELPAGIKKHFGIAVNRIETEQAQVILLSDNKVVGGADAVIVATGFDFFDARLKEEFGYGMYKQVITSADLEQILKTNPSALKKNGADPASIAFVHCVGSRDQQIGIGYCSRLCCITGIKQAIEVKELYPSASVVNFYIDIRAFGTGYEELYREAQEKYRIRFIRGRVSEASENQQYNIVLKAEDTLMARPLKLTVDWLVLLVGMVPSCTQVELDNKKGVDGETGFYDLADPLTGSRISGQEGVFSAGACNGPMSIPEAIASGRSAAMEAFNYIHSR
ncbi:MAG: FAD-dependent oxidoreductase [Bacteroidales bacterium]|jgi:heterodisulfide reductase subunit A